MSPQTRTTSTHSAVAISMVLAFLAAVALAKYRFGGRRLFIVLMIGILMLPQVGLIIPLYVVLARYHLTNTLTGVILTYLTFTLPFAVWTLRGFILGIPKELEEDYDFTPGQYLTLRTTVDGDEVRRSY